MHGDAGGPTDASSGLLKSHNLGRGTPTCIQKENPSASQLFFQSTISKYNDSFDYKILTEYNYLKHM